jgi:serine/threonine-protein kinase RsbW
VERRVFHLRSVLASVSVAERQASRLAEEAGLDADSRDQLALAAREAVANAVIHGNRLDPELPVRLRLDRDVHHVTVTVTDQGPGFTPGAAREPAANLTPTGRGLVLMAHCVDTVDVIRHTDPPGCDLVLVKHLPEGQPDGHDDLPSPAERRHHPRPERQDHPR